MSEKNYTAIGFEGIIEFLNLNRIKNAIVDKDEMGHSRTISFTVYGVEYRIEWYCNQSTLLIGSHSRAARIPFKYIYLDRTFPLVKANRSMGFSYVKKEKQSIFDREFPYEVFRIPLELESEADHD